jgi:hypothetical protein
MPWKKMEVLHPFSSAAMCACPSDLCWRCSTGVDLMAKYLQELVQGFAQRLLQSWPQMWPIARCATLALKETWNFTIWIS